MTKTRATAESVWATMMVLSPRRGAGWQLGRGGGAIRFISSSARGPATATWRAEGVRFRHLQLRALRHHHDGRVVRRSQLDARFLHGSLGGSRFALFNIQLGEIISRRWAAGLYGMLVFVVLAVSSPA